MKERNKSIYLAIALTTKCNYKCFYCKKGGESLSSQDFEVSFSELKQIIKIAYDLGINSFRITGGEPTIVDYFGQLLKFILNLGNDTRIRINTNGFRLLQYIDIIVSNKERLDIVISVDSLNEYVNGVYFPKYLSKDVQNITKQLLNNKVSVRYNVVVTKLNIVEIEQLVIESLDKMNVNLKLLDFNRQEEYFGENKNENKFNPKDFWSERYVSLESLKPFLESISNEYKPEYHQWIAYGIPMSAYFRNGHMIQIKDSSKGACYSKICKTCKYYNDCQEGIFSPFLSSNLMLHMSGCKNESIHFDLKNSDEEYIRECFNKILNLYEDIHLNKDAKIL